MKLKSAIIPLTAAIGLAFAGAAHAQEVVKIAHVGPLSGPNAHMGKDNENGARMAVEELNAKGFTIGGKKVKFELVGEDSLQILPVRGEQLAHRSVMTRQKNHEGAPDVVRNALVLKEAVNVEEISRVLAVERRAELAAIQVWQ
jgi:hypothetical protein